MEEQYVIKNLLLNSASYKLGLSQEEEDKLAEIKPPLIISAELNDDGTIQTMSKGYDDIAAAANDGATILMEAVYHSNRAYLEVSEWKEAEEYPYFSFHGSIRMGTDVYTLDIYIFEDDSLSFSQLRAYQLKEEKVSAWTSTPTDNNYPTEKLCWDTFMRKPAVIYDDPVGFEASNDYAGDTWHLTGLDLTPYKRLKFYVKSGGDSNSNYSPTHIVEMSLDSRCLGTLGYYTASHTGHNPNNRNRLHIATFAVNEGKTSIQFLHSISLYGTSASDSIGGRKCFLIEGYYD